MTWLVVTEGHTTRVGDMQPGDLYAGNFHGVPGTDYIAMVVAPRVFDSPGYFLVAKCNRDDPRLPFRDKHTYPNDVDRLRYKITRIVWRP